MGDIHHVLSHHLLQSAYEEYLCGNFETAEKYCMEYCKNSDSDETTLLLLASIHLALKNLDEAEKFVCEAIILNPHMADSYNIFARICRSRGQMEEALYYFKKCVSKNSMFIDAYISIATILVENNKIDEAIETYVTILEKDPKLHNIRNLLGTILKDLGRLEEAKNCFLMVIEMNPNFAPAWNNLGCVSYAKNEKWLAIHYFEKSTQLDPTFLNGHMNLGNVLKELRILDKARIAYGRALDIEPNKNPFLLANLGYLYCEEGKKTLAIEYYKRAINLKSDFPDAYCSLANTLKELGCVEESEKYYYLALEKNPTHPDSLNNLANIKREKGELHEALKLYLAALCHYPKFAIAHSNVASIYKLLGDFDRTLKHYDKAIEIKPDFSDAYINKGNVLREMLEYEEADWHFELALNINPTSADAYYGKANLFKDHGRVSEAIEYYKHSLQLRQEFPDSYCHMVHALLMTCDWTNYNVYVKKVVEIVMKQLEKGDFPSVHPHHTMLYPFPMAIHKLVAQKYAHLCEEKAKMFNMPIFLVINNPKRIKIGYISSDFGNHPTSHLMQSIPGLHNRSIFDVYCYALNSDDGTNFRSKIAKQCDYFIDLSVEPCHKRAARVIQSDGIQILVNMNGYTKGARNEIFALRAAPIQVMWLGYPGTSGSNFIDYLITDKTTSPLEFAEYYSEKFAYMPGTFMIGDHKQMFPHLKERIIVVDPSEDSNDLYDTNMVMNCVETTVLRRIGEFKEIKENVGNTVSYVVYKKILMMDTSKIQQMIQFKEPEVDVNGVSVCNGVMHEKFNPKVITGEEPPKSVIVTARSQYGLPNDVIVYCNFNQLYKFDPDIFAVWIDILKSVPKSVLWLLRFPAEGEENIRKTASKLNFPKHRIIFSDVAPKEEHVRRSQLADICLDTGICNGHTTNMDILWTGTPVVTLSLDTAASRIGASQLNTLECTQLITNNKKDYKELAIKLGKSRELLRLTRINLRIRQKNNPLFDCLKFVRNLEKLYKKMLDRHNMNYPPNHLNLDECVC